MTVSSRLKEQLRWRLSLTTLAPGEVLTVTAYQMILKYMEVCSHRRTQSTDTVSNIWTKKRHEWIKLLQSSDNGLAPALQAVPKAISNVSKHTCGRILQYLHIASATFFPRSIIPAIQFDSLPVDLLLVFFAGLVVEAFGKLNHRLKVNVVCRIAIIIFVTFLVTVVCATIGITRLLRLLRKERSARTSPRKQLITCEKQS